MTEETEDEQFKRRDKQTDRLTTLMVDFVRYTAYASGIDFPEPPIDIVLHYVNGNMQKVNEWIDQNMKWPLE